MEPGRTLHQPSSEVDLSFTGAAAVLRGAAAGSTLLHRADRREPAPTVA
ncbi:hypothetical protein QT196_30690 [Streptomyces sp. P9-2B-2]|nr:hypothetical protein [Streptomyces sp. P9-2B-2]WJY41290.1 hypothetical protein QT196_30690 [Streptomyces sp. P9-2B-2]